VDQFQGSQLLLGWDDRTRKPACLHLEGKRKGLRMRNLVGRVPGTRAPRGPISRIPAVAWVGRPYPTASVPPPRGKTKRPTYTKLGRKGPWDTSTPGPISIIPAVAWVGRPYPKASVPPPRGETKRPTNTKLGRKDPRDTSTPWTNFNNPSSCLGGPTVPDSQRSST